MREEIQPMSSHSWMSLNKSVPTKLALHTHWVSLSPHQTQTSLKRLLCSLLGAHQ